MTKIPLYLKLKPLSGPTKFTNNQKVIQQSSLKENAIDIVSGKDADNNFKVASSYSFDKVFNEECTTSTLYNLILHNSIQDLIFKQADTTVFTLGPSNSGKSYSLFGKNNGNSGMIHYALKELFNQTEKWNGSNYEESVFHEILGVYYGGLLLNANDIVDDPKQKRKQQPDQQQQQQQILLRKNVMKDNTNDNESIRAGKSTKGVNTAPVQSKQIISISMYEIYNDSIIDLLELTKDYAFLKKQIKKQSHKSTEIFTDMKDGKIKPANIFTISVSSFEQAELLIESGLKRRHVSSTNINSMSSRSHLFLLVNVHSISLKDLSKSSTIKPTFSSSLGKSVLTHDAFPGKQLKVKTSRLTISDLACSERSKAAQTGNNKTAFHEGNVTNQSLTELGRILNILNKSKNKTKEKSLIRTDKLTRLLLSDYISNPDNKLAILVNINPYGDIATILSTLRLISPLPKFKNSLVNTTTNSTRLSTFNFRINFRAREPKTLKSPASSITSSPSTPKNASFEGHRSGACNSHVDNFPTPLSLSSVSSRVSTIVSSNDNNNTNFNNNSNNNNNSNSAIAFRRLSMLQKTPPSPIVVRGTTGSNCSSFKKRSNTSPLVESFTASNQQAINTISSPCTNASTPSTLTSPTNTKQGRTRSSPTVSEFTSATRYTHQQSLSASANISFDTVKANGNILGNIATSGNSSSRTQASSVSKNESWPSVSTVTSTFQAVESCLKSLDINLSNNMDKSQIIEKIAFRGQSLFDENLFLKERNKFLEAQLSVRAQETINSQNAEIEKLQGELKQAKQKMNIIESQNAASNSKIVHLSKENNNLKQYKQDNERALEYNNNVLEKLKQSKQYQEREISKLKEQVKLSNEEIVLLKNELHLANEDLENIKQKFTVLAFQHREYREKLAQNEKSASQSSSNSSSDTVKPTDASNFNTEDLNSRRERDRISSFYFASFSFNSTANDVDEKEEQPVDLTEPFFKPEEDGINEENLTSKSSAIFDDLDTRSDDKPNSSATNSQYGSENEALMKNYFSSAKELQKTKIETAN